MANVQIIEKDGMEARVKVFSSHNRSVSIMPYSLWQEIKDAFGIDENTVDAYDYLDKYDAQYSDRSFEIV